MPLRARTRASSARACATPAMTMITSAGSTWIPRFEPGRPEDRRRMDLRRRGRRRRTWTRPCVLRGAGHFAETRSNPAVLETDQLLSKLIGSDPRVPVPRAAEKRSAVSGGAISAGRAGGSGIGTAATTVPTRPWATSCPFSLSLWYASVTTPRETCSSVASRRLAEAGCRRAADCRRSRRHQPSQAERPPGRGLGRIELKEVGAGFGSLNRGSYGPVHRSIVAAT